MDNFIKIYDEDGKESKVEVLDIFQVEGYEGKDYILYTQNKELDENNIEVFVSILEQNGDDFSLLNIEDEVEWETVQKAIDEMSDIYEQ